MNRMLRSIERFIQIEGGEEDDKPKSQYLDGWDMTSIISRAEADKRRTRVKRFEQHERAKAINSGSAKVKWKDGSSHPHGACGNSL